MFDRSRPQRRHFNPTTKAVKMHTYRKVTYPTVQYAVGYWRTDGRHDDWHSGWEEVKRFDNEDDAAKYASFLNGGTKP